MVFAGGERPCFFLWLGGDGRGVYGLVELMEIGMSGCGLVELMEIGMSGCRLVELL
jgi:hypothetical protein